MISSSFTECEALLTQSGVPIDESGAAVVLCLALGDQLWVATAGDAWCTAGVLYEDKWHALQLSVDCKPESESERLCECGGVLVYEGDTC